MSKRATKNRARLGPEGEVAAATAIEGWLEGVAEREFATTLEDDEQTLKMLRALPAATGDESIAAALLEYRIQRKQLWRVALDVLAAHKEVHGGHDEYKV